VPQIETMPVKRGDPVPSRYQFRLGDGEVDLSEAFSLGGSYGSVVLGRCPLLGNSRSASGVGKWLRRRAMHGWWQPTRSE